MTHIKLTKAGLPDKRSESSKANCMKARETVKQVFQKAKKEIEGFESDSSNSESSESEEEEEIIEEEIVKPKRVSKRKMIEDLNEKIEKLLPKENKIEVVKEEVVKEEVVKEVQKITYNNTKHPVFKENSAPNYSRIKF